MSNQSSSINTLVQLGSAMKQGDFNGLLEQACYENLWFTVENYKDVLTYWSSQLVEEKLTKFSNSYTPTANPKKVGIIMAGNIPLVGFHDLLCVLLIGHKPVVKMSSNDKVVLTQVIEFINTSIPSKSKIEVVESMKGIDAVIATGSNNTFRYFEHYFRDIPSVLRKSRTSISVISGEEKEDNFALLGKDVFHHFGLGCRNVSLLLLPEGFDITKILDAWKDFSSLLNQNKYANNYTYHKALYLMNNEAHLDTGYVLVKEKTELHSPLGCIYYSYYTNDNQLASFIEKNEKNIQCVVGNYSKLANVPFGKSQYPDLQDFADKIDTLRFLEKI